MQAQALDAARLWGPPVIHGCGVCQRPWEGGPTLVRGRARHLCPSCAERIAEDAENQPPGPLTTWLWCTVAGICGLLLQLLFHQSWTVIPLAVVAGWLMGTANGPNFERHPFWSPVFTILLLGLLQISGWALITGAQLGAAGAAQLGMIFIWTVVSLPPGVVAGFSAGTLGMGMAILEHRLQQP
jgi:hypothetical protein